MKVVTLGAGGGMGSTAARHLATIDAITELVLADLDAETATRTAASLPQSPASVNVATVDILDERSIRGLLDSADLVVNCSGPFFRLGVPALRAAIETGTHYVDICDDPDPTAAMFELDDAARRAGVVAVIGMGASPGLSNLLAVRAAGHLDAVEDCYTAWPLDVPTPGTEPAPARAASAATDRVAAAAVIHLMEQIHSKVTVVEAGRLVRRRPLAAVELEYPGRRPGTGYTVGHSEPLTLRDSLGISGQCANIMLLSSGTTVAYLRGLQHDLDAEKMSLEEAAAALMSPTPERSQAAVAGSKGTEGPGGLPPFFALARGVRGGVRTTAACHVTAFPRGMDGATAIPAALAVRQLLEHLPSPGVHAPERVIDADRLLSELIPHCRPVVGSLDALAPVVVAPE